MENPKKYIIETLKNLIAIPILDIKMFIIRVAKFVLCR